MNAEEIKQAREIIAAAQSLVANDFASRASLEFTIAARTCWAAALDEIERLEKECIARHDDGIIQYENSIADMGKIESLRQERDRLAVDVERFKTTAFQAQQMAMEIAAREKVLVEALEDLLKDADPMFGSTERARAALAGGGNE